MAHYLVPPLPCFAFHLPVLSLLCPYAGTASHPIPICEAFARIQESKRSLLAMQLHAPPPTRQCWGSPSAGLQDHRCSMLILLLDS